ncbi:MAG: protein-L-isoaspartate(D-aspartate) O-methyltransferase [Nitrospinae bacterium]|nr:protein-L-isoaspartate(D-aspartate) O-methyltransferase [Nitrospinota bacterium]MBF0633944.1 protein-L-isoaspartate(D-aspartate) O-methyltransferase [Nitrospinota bacterium]
MKKPEEIARAKQVMIEIHLKGRGITNPAVLSAMESVPREKFVEKSFMGQAYDDNPLPIGNGQTISQPYIVALMTQELDPKKTDRVLEVGTGSGYQAAVLSKIVDRVYTIEIVKPLAEASSALLKRLGYDNVTVQGGDGYAGWKEHAPFDKIIVTAAAGRVPKPLEEQLAEGGLIIMPVGGSHIQDLLLGEKRDGVVSYRTVAGVRFVPMTGRIQEQ